MTRLAMANFYYTAGVNFIKFAQLTGITSDCTAGQSSFERDSPTFRKTVPRHALILFGTQFVPL